MAIKGDKSLAELSEHFEVHANQISHGFLIFNTDQGSQFTSSAFTDVLKAHYVQISMDGKGR